MSTQHTAVYNQDHQLLGILDNADTIGYSLCHNDLWTASFALPNSDAKNALCTAHTYVELRDGARDLGLYRIITMPSSPLIAMNGMTQYSVEHVMATLLDDVLFGYHEIGGEGIPLADVISYILSQQTVSRWVPGTCEFDPEYSFKFENDTLLSALLSLGNVLTDEYTWDFDTSVTPWEVNLRYADSEANCGMHYKRNLKGVEKTMDATALVTRLYLLGYGEGVNQLTIKDVNDGLPYIDADTVDTWGVKCTVYADTRLEDAQTLKATGQALLEQLKDPYITYTASAIDLAEATGQDWDLYMPGKLVRVMDGEHGINFDARIVSVEKSDVRGRGGDVSLTIANLPRDAADSLNTLADRIGISELYSQGATNLYSQQYADNANGAYPAVMRVYIPEGCVRINQMLLYWQLTDFRAYETGAAAGGATVSTSSSSGGGSQTSESGGGYYEDIEASTGGPKDSAGLSSKTETDAGGDGSTGYRSPSTGQPSSTSFTGSADGTVGSHQHTILHTHTVSSHSHSMDEHTHGMNHWHQVTVGISISSHTHTVTIPAHTHSVSVGTHTHDMVFGIYVGGQASGISITVDGNAVPADEITSSELDIVAYLETDEDGKITRGEWHEIQLIPDALTRIEANLFVQTFVQSRGGGDY